jgi:hypothetical protein
VKGDLKNLRSIYMKLSRKFLLACLVPFSLGMHAQTLSYDFNLGLGIGIQAPPLLIEHTGNDFTETAFSWTPIGGFLGAGISFGESLLSSVGLEYTGYWQINHWKHSSSLDNFTMEFNNFYQFVDIYYKVGILTGTLPMDVQLNLGLAIQSVMGGSVDLHASGFGSHVGLRANVHMFFLGLDYSFIPKYFYKGDIIRSQDFKNIIGSGFNSNIFGVTVGLIFNKGVWNAFWGEEV